MYWVIQNNIYSEEGHTKLIEALERLNLPHSLHKVVPFAGVLDPDVSPPNGKVIVMGSYTLARVAQSRGWTPGSFINENLDYKIQLDHWGNRMLNHDAVFCPLGQVPFQETPFFIRPIEDSKAFVGQIMDWGSLEEWKESLNQLTTEDNPTVDLATPVMVCPKKEIYNETRTWVINGKVVTASRYKIGTIKQYSDQVEPRIIDFVNELDWYPVEACVIDIADTSEGLKIVEVNNLNSSGFYKADMNKLVISLEEAFG